MHSRKTSISLHENAIPHFVEHELERLYENIYSSVAHFRIYGPTGNVSTYLARRGDQIISLLLFRREKGKVEVVNEGMTLTEEEIRRFAGFIFSKFPSVRMITFHAVVTDVRRLPYPNQRFNCSEDIVLALPGSEQQYLASLGKSTRSYVNRYMNRLRRDFPSMRHEVYLQEQVSESDVRTIADFNRQRMGGKNKTSMLEESEIRRITALVRSCGMLSMIRIDGLVCAGLIIYRTGRNYFLETVAHDPAYDEYRLGTLCCYLTICECIKRGGKEFHFLWGQSEYKYRLLGVQRNLEHLVLYHSRLHALLSAPAVLQNACRDLVRRLKLRLHRARLENASPLKSRAAAGCLRLLGSLRHMLTSASGKRKDIEAQGH